VPAASGRRRSFASSGYTGDRHTLGNIRLERGQGGEAIKDYERATQIAPENQEAWRSLATAKEGANDLEGTLAAYRRAIEIAPIIGGLLTLLRVSFRLCSG
jgi:Flp pilus assembly protein TadD